MKTAFNMEARRIAWEDAQNDMGLSSTQQRLNFEMKAKVGIKCACSSSAG
jgi:hypothetical protein